MTQETITPDTPPAPLPTSAAGLLEHALQLCQGQVQDALASAAAVTHDAYDYHGYRGREFDRALKFLDRTARVGMVLARLQGQHASNIQVTRVDVPAPPPPHSVPRTKITPEVEARINKIYADWQAERARREAAGLDPDYWDDEQGEGGPHEGSGGSNTGK